MKVKNFNGTVRRRGTTIAAAALSVSLIAPFVHPIAAPQTAAVAQAQDASCLLYTSPSPRDLSTSRMPSSA